MKRTTKNKAHPNPTTHSPQPTTNCLCFCSYYYDKAVPTLHFEPIITTMSHSLNKKGVEDAAQLKLGDEFQDIVTLSNAQVAVFLQLSAQSAVNRDEELHEVYTKTQHYVDRVNNMTNPEKNHQELVRELDNLME